MSTRKRTPPGKLQADSSVAKNLDFRSELLGEIEILRRELAQREHDCKLAGEYGAELVKNMQILKQSNLKLAQENEDCYKSIYGLESENSSLRSKVEELTQTLDIEHRIREKAEHLLERELDHGDTLRSDLLKHDILEHDIRMLQCTAAAAQIELRANISLLKLTQEQLDSANEEKSNAMLLRLAERATFQAELNTANATISRLYEDMEKIRSDNLRLTSLLHTREKSLALAKEQLACVTAQIQETELQFAEQAASYEKSLSEANTSLTEAYAKLALSPAKKSYRDDSVDSTSGTDDDQNESSGMIMCTPIKMLDDSISSSRRRIILEDEELIFAVSNGTTIACKLESPTNVISETDSSFTFSSVPVSNNLVASSRSGPDLFRKLIQAVTPRHTDIAINTVCLAIFFHILTMRR